MQIFKKTTTFDFMGKRRNMGILSAIAVVLSVVAVFTVGPKFGIDFMGGTEIQVKFQQDVDVGQLRQALDRMGFPGSDVVAFGAGETEYLLRMQSISPVSDAQAVAANDEFVKKYSDQGVKRFEFSPGGDKLTIKCGKEIDIAELEKTLADLGLSLGEKVEVKATRGGAEGAEETEQEKASANKRCESATCTWPLQDMRVYEVNLKGVAERVIDGLREESFGKGALKMRSEWVGPKVGQQMQTAGISSIVYALLFIMLYIAVRFDLRFAPGAVVALVHDVCITMGIFTILRVEVTLATVAALLTIVGYSLNDTIVIFDRIRENISKTRERALSKVINTSINETLSRTVLTSVTTLLVVVVLISVGWQTTIRDFAFALIVGVFVGTYSSIFVASPVVVWVDKRLGKKKA